MQIDGRRLIKNIEDLGKTGLDAQGRRSRTAASDADKAARDLVCMWMEEAGMRVAVDKIGNLFGIWDSPDNKGEEPFMTGSHIDTVINAGKYDGCLGVLAGIEIVRTLKENSVKPVRPVVVAAFTNEEGVRYAPDMLGSLVYAGGMDVEDALKIRGVDGSVLGDELKRIGYAGSGEPGFAKPCAFIELHIEQGPILDQEGIQIGAVARLRICRESPGLK